MSDSNILKIIREVKVDQIKQLNTGGLIIGENEKNISILVSYPILKDSDVSELINKYEEKDLDNLEKAMINYITCAKVKIIYPLSEDKRERFFQKTVSFEESHRMYMSTCLQTVYNNKWIQNIIDGTAINDKAVDSNENFILCKNYKWSEKKEGVDKMDLLCISKSSYYKSVREIDSVEFCESAKKLILNYCDRTYGLIEKDLAIFVHYSPQFYWLHFHVINISKNIYKCGSFLRNIYLDEIIRNLKIDLNYYKGNMPCLNKK